MTLDNTIAIRPNQKRFRSGLQYGPGGVLLTAIGNPKKCFAHGDFDGFCIPIDSHR